MIDHILREAYNTQPPRYIAQVFVDGQWRQVASSCNESTAASQGQKQYDAIPDAVAMRIIDDQGNVVA